MERNSSGKRCGKCGDENTFKGFSRAKGRRGQPQEMANSREARVQIEGAVSKAAGRTCRAIELATAASLCIQPPCRPADLSGDGCGRKRWRHPARDVRRQSTRLPGI